MIEIQDELYKDLEAVRQISIVPSMLEMICQITGMGFAAIARVTSDRWLACSVRDEVQFGLPVGGELKIETTLCNEIRNHRQLIIIDHVEADPHYKHHHTPQIYGLQSYISIPIILKDGTFFGTLCAIDTKPVKINNTKVISTFTMFAELLAFHLQSQELMDRSYQANQALVGKNTILTQVNTDLDTIVYTASHDLKTPVANIESLLNMLADTIEQEEIDRAEINQIMGMLKSSVQRFAVTIKDLTTIVEADQSRNEKGSEVIAIFEIVDDVKQDLNQLIINSKASIEVFSPDSFLLNISKKNFRSILYNLLSNALKYRSSERTPQVRLNMEQVEGRIQLSVRDNGLGIPTEKQDQVFTLFKRLHNHVEGSGLGLYIVKRLVENAKGQIQVNSTLNKGTTFTIIFPMAI
ncbi:sensor histidine kinase [Adhaeribacter rhizoryzae]|uniref:histidine kinase n=1 Tax=Adhaeribacter rhizoryzae TaxID=2607907 RepID=A0A5M6CZY2_9BACT|nr:GAF domain-containing sensor histidine kinase [Adhaeribacter rhizoryzae]KAA5538849.1 GAF domain-containing sensor histidine kinase [Adhaeribacter rhizoryzae]